MKNYKTYFVILLFLLDPAFADNKSFIKSTFFTYENDSIYSGDGYYSNGLQFYFSTIDKELNNTLYNYSFGIGQKIFTPKDIEYDNFIIDDRLYAGYLYTFFNKNIYYDTKMDTFGISIGLTGPNSLAEDIQTKIHDMIGSPTPMGWKYQTNNEILFSANFKRSIEIFKMETSKYDLKILSKIELNLGTPITGITPSIEFRYGKNLEKDFLSNKISLTPQEIIINGNKTYYFFLELSPTAIAYNTFLDKRNIKNYKTNINKNWFQYQIIGGFALRYKQYYLKYATIFLSKEFDKQKDPQVILSLNIGYLFGN